MGRLRWSLYVAACLCRRGSGDVAQWLRSDGPLVSAKAPDRADALTVIDALSAEDRVFVLAATTAFNLQTTLKLGDHGAFFACDFGGVAGATVRASVNPGVTRDATSAVLVECRLPEPCYDGDLTVTFRGPGRLRGAIAGVRHAGDGGAPRAPAGAGDLAYCLAPVFGANLNAALLIEWVEYHVGLGFDRIHYYDMNFGGGGDADDVRATTSAGALVVHDWTMAVNPGPLWANPNAATKETVMYAQSLALYDCFLREHTNDRASRGGRPSDWVFYGDVDEVFVAPLVEARKAPDLKALMATAPNATKYLVHNSVITVFERDEAPAMARSPLALSAVRERATRSVPGAPTPAHAKWCARSRFLGSLHPLYLNVHNPMPDVGAPRTRPPPGWPVNGDARALTFHFFHNHYVSNPPRKAQMRSGAKVMRGIKFAPREARHPQRLRRRAAAALRNLGPTLTPIYDCWRRRLHGQRYAASKSLINFFFVVDGAAPCANETEPPPWRPGRSRYCCAAPERAA
ncbi:hypothetical protein JL722_13755 [Aureococcus anophagefferens]|nr:hypothetical protein JL722_13755 [Aureococcus anophagefferens]